MAVWFLLFHFDLFFLIIFCDWLCGAYMIIINKLTHSAETKQSTTTKTTEQATS